MTNDSESWRGIPSDRVVAVLARLDSGRVQVGSGYLLTNNSVITARHCTIDKKTARPAAGLQIVRLSDGFQSATGIVATSLDMAVLGVSRAVPAVLPLPQYGRVDTTHSAELSGCEAVGFPLWQLDPLDHRRNSAQIHGTIRTTEGAEDGLLVLRDRLLADVQVPSSVSGEDRASNAWGGLSGALVFRMGVALGVIIEHYPWRGGSALTVLPIQRLAALSQRGDPDAVRVAAALGLPVGGELPVVGSSGGGSIDRARLILGVTPVDGQDGRASWIAVKMLADAGISPEHCERQDEADGSRLVILPAGLDPAFALPALLRAARLAVDHANPEGGGGNGRLLLAAGSGVVQLAADGYVGPGIAQARTMIAGDAVRRSLREAAGADLVAVLSDPLYLDLCARNPSAIAPARFRAVSLAVPGTPHKSRAWVYVPESPASTQFDHVSPGVPTARSQALSLDIIPLAGMGTALWWQSSHHDHPHGQAQADNHESAGHDSHPTDETSPDHEIAQDQDGITDEEYSPDHSVVDDLRPVYDRFDLPGADDDEYHHPSDIHHLSVDEFAPIGDSADSGDFGDASGW